MLGAEMVKEALRICTQSGTITCVDCPYFNDMTCVNSLASDAAEYIASLEERISIMQESMEALEKRCNALEKLKDPDRIKAIRCKDCRYFEPCNAEEGDYSGYCRNDYAPCQNQTVDAWWYCGSAERVSE